MRHLVSAGKWDRFPSHSTQGENVFTLAITAAAAFNLVCSGTYASKSMSQDDSEPYQAIYRVDLETNRYCSRDCKVVKSIARVEATSIIFEEEKTDTVREQRSFVDRVDRLTGEHFSTLSNRSSFLGLMLLSWDGKCEKADFTGFPTFDTKF
jgi:hypothetical protein